ncbi:MAG: hypothetical protein KGZ30_01395 [Anaplasmataceae bacterium]|nr:hypothetical protein [Anaplasmataceae bacterium]
MKIYLDDLRIVPDGWVGAETAQEAILLLQENSVEEISLDHDLGDPVNGNGNDVLVWIEQAVVRDGYVPPIIKIHTGNPSARVKMELGVEAINRLSRNNK